jgi:hypothetical protein
MPPFTHTRELAVSGQGSPRETLRPAPRLDQAPKVVLAMALTSWPQPSLAEIRGGAAKTWPQTFAVLP